MLELKVIADVGLVGFPNVGKSTFLSRVTNANPKIANYHFTTLNPNLGVVDMDGSKGFVIADIPGIIEGASEGVGLGFEFLRHIERTKVMIHMVDGASVEGRDPIVDIHAITDELKKDVYKRQDQGMDTGERLSCSRGNWEWKASKCRRSFSKRRKIISGVCPGKCRSVSEGIC